MTVPYKPPGSTFLSAGKREAMYKAKTPFTITSANEGPGKFGQGYTYTLRITDPKTGEVTSAFITLSYNARRGEDYSWICAALVEAGSEGVGPCRLDKVETDKGNPAWLFVGV